MKHNKKLPGRLVWRQGHPKRSQARPKWRLLPPARLSRSRFFACFPAVGFLGDAELLLTLPARVGIGRARPILLYAEPVGAEADERVALVDQIVPNRKGLERAVALAHAFDAFARLSTAVAKEALAGQLDAVLDWERSAQAALFQTTDQAEGEAAFPEKRPLIFRGR